ncbi:MAG: DUF1573 domain-containing protein [Flavobacteriales bacterium]
MKKWSLFCAAALLMISCGSKQKNLADLVSNPASAEGGSVSAENAAKIEFSETEYNFGEITQGQVVEHSFRFKNTGKVDLVISDTKTTCGCTTPEWPKEPIPVGGTGEIKAKFDSAGKMDKQEKVITVIANTVPTETKIKLVGNVLAP